MIGFTQSGFQSLSKWQNETIVEPPKSLHPYFDTPYSQEEELRSVNKRKRELTIRVNELFKKMGGKFDIELDINLNPFPSDGAYVGDKSIIVPHLLFISPDEFPDVLKVNGPDDPKINLEYLHQLRFWLCRHFPIQEHDLDWRDIHTFKLYLRLMQNAEKIKQAYDFIICHELAHILHGHSKKSRNSSFWSSRFTLFPVSIAIKIYEPLANYLDKITNGLPTKVHEWEADETAVAFTKDKEGPIYLFETVKKQGIDSLNDPKVPRLAKLFFTSQGDHIPLLFSHKLESNRIAAILAL